MDLKIEDVKIEDVKIEDIKTNDACNMCSKCILRIEGKHMCTTCKVLQPVNQFYLQKKVNRLNPMCKACTSINRREYRKTDNYVYVNRGTLASRTLTDTLKTKMRKEHTSGLSIAVIAKRYNIKYITLYTWFKRGLV